ncbi:MAG: hypothetical protein JWP12_3871 [Bacteroidetes bacterium]|nr:hypothetical protein [Bacteroidota bacterium]
MNSKKYIKTGLILVAAITAFTFSSCKKDKDETPVPAGNGTLLFHLHTNVDTSEVEDYGDLHVMTNNRKIIVNKAQLYISNIQLIKLDGSTYSVPGKIMLKKMEEEEYMIGSVPAGNYRSVKFDVGLSSSTNVSVPASGDSTLNQPAMWFGATAQPAGFVFVDFEGTVDTTTAANGSIAQMQSFTYRIGTNANLRTVTLPNQNYTVSPNQAQFVHMTIDYNKIFTGIPLNVSSNLNMSTTADNAGWLGTQLSDNISSMFSYEE